MANYTLNSDLVDAVLFAAGENETAASNGGSAYYTATIRYLNRAYQAIWRGGGELLPDVSETWWWLRAHNNGVITLLPVFDSGTVLVTNNNTSITFSSAPQRNSSNISLQGYHFKVDDHADVFYISSHTSGATGATLDSVYTGPTDTAASFRAFKIDYTLASDVLELTSAMYAFQGGLTGTHNKIESISQAQLREKWPMEQISPGVPANFSRIAASSQAQVVRFSHYGGQSDTELIRIDYDYLAEPADIADDSNECVVPREFRRILVDWATFFVMQDKEDSSADKMFSRAAAGLRQMAEENRRYNARTAHTSYARIHPRPSRRALQKGPLRTESGVLIGG